MKSAKSGADAEGEREARDGILFVEMCCIYSCMVAFNFFVHFWVVQVVLYLLFSVQAFNHQSAFHILLLCSSLPGY